MSDWSDTPEVSWAEKQKAKKKLQAQQKKKEESESAWSDEEPVKPVKKSSKPKVVEPEVPKKSSKPKKTSRSGVVRRGGGRACQTSQTGQKILETRTEKRRK